MRLALLMPLVMLTMSCDFVGRTMAKFIPALEKTNEDWAPPQMDCESNIPTRSPTRCVAGKIRCGDIIEGHSAAGKKRWDDAFYRGAKCVPASHGYTAAPEMTYRLKLEPHTDAVVTLVSDCADLDLFGFRWEEKGSCPTNKHYQRIGECEMDDTKRGGKIKLNSVMKPATYLIGVDGKKGAVGNYRLSVECRNSL